MSKTIYEIIEEISLNSKSTCTYYSPCLGECVSRDLKLINFTKQMYIELTEKESEYIFASYYEEKLTLENNYD